MIERGLLRGYDNKVTDVMDWEQLHQQQAALSALGALVAALGVWLGGSVLLQLEKKEKFNRRVNLCPPVQSSEELKSFNFRNFTNHKQYLSMFV